MHQQIKIATLDRNEMGMNFVKIHSKMDDQWPNIFKLSKKHIITGEIQYASKKGRNLNGGNHVRFQYWQEFKCGNPVLTE